MSQSAAYPTDSLQAVLVDHQDTFEILADSDHDDVAALLGEFPLELIDELPSDGGQDE